MSQAKPAAPLIFSDDVRRSEPGVFAPLRDTLLTRGDYFLHLANLKSYEVWSAEPCPVP